MFTVEKVVKTIRTQQRKQTIGFKLKIGRGKHYKIQCWTEGRSSTALAEDLRPTDTATVAEGLICSFLSFFSKMEAEIRDIHWLKCKLSCIFITKVPPVFRLD